MIKKIDEFFSSSNMMFQYFIYRNVDIVLMMLKIIPAIYFLYILYVFFFKKEKHDSLAWHISYFSVIAALSFLFFRKILINLYADCYHFLDGYENSELMKFIFFPVIGIYIFWVVIKFSIEKNRRNILPWKNYISYFIIVIAFAFITYNFLLMNSWGMI